MRSSFLVDFFSARFLKRFLPAYRQPSPARVQHFHLRNIYIIPGKVGMGLVGIVLLTLVAAINFQNSLIYMVSFWLASLLVINVMYSYRNLSGLQVELLGAESCFAGQVCQVSLLASSQGHKESIYAGWKGVDLGLIDLHDRDSQALQLGYPTTQRGWLVPPRLDIFTRYPAGLTIAWAYARLNIRVLVFPAPHILPELSPILRPGGTAEDGRALAAGVSDFYGMRAYQAGDNPRRIHWAKYAQTGKLYSKVFVDYEQHQLWLDWADLGKASIEQRLSHLCARVLQLSTAQQSYGLRIPGHILQPARGEVHRQACLAALALYPGGS